MSTPARYLELGQELRRARVALRLEQRGLAERIDVSPRAVRAWEAGTARPALARIDQLAGVLELDAGDLARRYDELENPTEVAS